MRPAGSPEELQRRRERCIALLREGYAPVEVARMVGVDRRSVRRWNAAFRTESLPAYAPELNPVEYFNAYLKMNPLANLPLFELDTLTTTARHHARALQHHEELLRSFIKHSPLSLRLI
jgi:transposase